MREPPAMSTPATFTKEGLLERKENLLGRKRTLEKELREVTEYLSQLEASTRTLDYSLTGLRYLEAILKPRVVGRVYIKDIDQGTLAEPNAHSVVLYIIFTDDSALTLYLKPSSSQVIGSFCALPPQPPPTPVTETPS